MSPIPDIMVSRPPIVSSFPRRQGIFDPQPPQETVKNLSRSPSFPLKERHLANRVVNKGFETPNRTIYQHRNSEPQKPKRLPINSAPMSHSDSINKTGDQSHQSLSELLTAFPVYLSDLNPQKLDEVSRLHFSVPDKTGISELLREEKSKVSPRRQKQIIRFARNIAGLFETDGELTPEEITTQLSNMQQDRQMTPAELALFGAALLAIVGSVKSKYPAGKITLAVAALLALSGCFPAENQSPAPNASAATSVLPAPTSTPDCVLDEDTPERFSFCTEKITEEYVLDRMAKILQVINSDLQTNPVAENVKSEMKQSFENILEADKSGIKIDWYRYNYPTLRGQQSCQSVIVDASITIVLANDPAHEADSLATDVHEFVHTGRAIQAFQDIRTCRTSLNSDPEEYEDNYLGNYFTGAAIQVGYVGKSREEYLEDEGFNTPVLYYDYLPRHNIGPKDKIQEFLLDSRIPERFHRKWDNYMFTREEAALLQGMIDEGLVNEKIVKLWEPKITETY